jgi:type I restriction enzyme S subunit
LQRIKKIDFSGNIHLDAETDTKTDMIRVKNGDLVVSGINAAKGAIAVHAEDEDVLATIHYSAYEFNSDRISVDFLKWFFKSPEFSDLLREQIPGGIKTELKPKHILPLKVKLPKLSEQITVAERLNRFRLEQLKLEHEIVHQKSLLAKLKQAILQEAIQGKLTTEWRTTHQVADPVSHLLQRIYAEKARLIAAKEVRPEKLLTKLSANKMPFEVPEGWEWCRLGNIAADVSYGTSQKAHVEAKGIPVLRMGNITSDGGLLLSDLKYVSPRIKDLPRLFLQSGDIVFNRTNSYELVGKSAVFREDQPFTLASYLIRVRLLEKLNPEYVAYFINSTICRAKFIEPDVIQQNGQANFNGSKLRTIPIPLPPLAEQNAIVKQVQALTAACGALEVEIEHSRVDATHLLQAVLKEAFAPAA